MRRDQLNKQLFPSMAESGFFLDFTKKKEIFFGSDYNKEIQQT
jgi:hypothetical protein